jgi:hypothetical protein
MEDSSMDEQPRHLDLIDLVWKIMEDEGELELFFAIAWNIWHARNQRRMGEQEKPLQQIRARMECWSHGFQVKA